MTVAPGTHTFNNIRLAKTGDRRYEVRGVRTAKGSEKLFIYLTRKDDDPEVNYVWRLSIGHTFEDSRVHTDRLDRSWKAKQVVDVMLRNGHAVEVKEHGKDRQVFQADMLITDKSLVDKKTKEELIEVFNEMAPVAGLTRLDEFRESKAQLVMRIVEAHGLLDGRKRRKAA